MTEEKLAKLPKWAQAHIVTLEQQRDQAQHEYQSLRKLQDQCADGTTRILIDHEQSDKQFVGNHTRVKFFLRDDTTNHWRNFVQCALYQYRSNIMTVQIMGGDTIEVIPAAANMAYIKLTAEHLI